VELTASYLKAIEADRMPHTEIREINARKLWDLLEKADALEVVM
jgi:hypothetical protein